MKIHKHEVIIVGAGGAGLMAALYASKKADTAVVSKLYPTRSHTGTAQGGVGAALGNMEEDHWEWHAFDTVKGSDYLADQDAVEVMCRDAITTIYELEHMGLPFDRTPNGKISQRRFGGHTNNTTHKAVMRACHAADRTGHMILQTLYQQCIKNKVNFFNEFQVVDLIYNNGVCSGVVAYEVATGEFHIFHGKAVMFATGGWGKVWSITSNAHTLTGDANAICLRRGIPQQDMEFFQFHPTGIYRMGILITEGVRGEGGILLNGKGERFMVKYAPTVKDLASRDVVSRAIYLEVRQGNGVDGQKYVMLDVTPPTVNKYFQEDDARNPDGSLRHLTEHDVEAKLEDIADFCKTYLGINPAKQPIPIQPTAHYAMGGISTDIDGRVLLDEQKTVIPGLYAAGECACVSVHGANRLGTNSLLDLVVFGKRAGEHIAQYVQNVPFPELPDNATDSIKALLENLKNSSGKETVAKIREEMQDTMMDNVGVFREKVGIEKAIAKIHELQKRYQAISFQDKGTQFNTNLLEAWELGCLLDLAEITAEAALVRTESRGGHSREDYKERDDKNWLKHSIAWKNERGVTLKYKPVTITKYQPKERVY